MEERNRPKLTKAESGRLGGLKGGSVGGRLSRGGGRPKTYLTDDERRAAAVARQQKYRVKTALLKRRNELMKMRAKTIGEMNAVRRELAEIERQLRAMQAKRSS